MKNNWNELINDRPRYIIGEKYEWLGLKDNKVIWEPFIMTSDILNTCDSYTIRKIKDGE
jgi:hypothetical protein